MEMSSYSTSTQPDLRPQAVEANAGLKRYTYRQLSTQAKQAFRRVQMSRPDGGLKQDYHYRGWDILVNNGKVLQIMNYDVITADQTLKRSIVIEM